MKNLKSVLSLLMFFTLPLMAEKDQLFKVEPNEVATKQFVTLADTNNRMMDKASEKLRELNKMEVFQEWLSRQQNANETSRVSTSVVIVACGLIGATALENPKLMWLKLLAGGCAVGGVGGVAWIDAELRNTNDLQKKSEWTKIKDLVAEIRYDLEVAGNARNAIQSMNLAYRMPTNINIKMFEFPSMP